MMSDGAQHSKPDFYQQRHALWNEHEAIRTGFVADIAAGKSTQEAYDHWVKPTAEFNRRVGEFSQSFANDPVAQWERKQGNGNAREFDLERQRTIFENRQRRLEKAAQRVEESTGMGMGL
jgi:hypothetical protein